MPLFDPANAKSCEWRAIVGLADLLSLSDSFIELCEASTSVEAREKIQVGVPVPPKNGETYTAEELAVRHLFANLYPSGQYQVGESDAAGGEPDRGGWVRCRMIRQVRTSETIDDAYNFFADRLSAVMDELSNLSRDQTKSSVRIRTLPRSEEDGPFHSPVKSMADQGEYVYGDFQIVWGDILAQ